MKFLVTMIAMHKIQETYVIESDKSIEELTLDIGSDPFQVYCGSEIDMLEDEFLGCEDLELQNVEELV